jgi:acetylornithine/succinyldiaminopimelate/putrescine aminotransferase
VCSEYDICLIFDEVQTGFGWLGYLLAADAMKATPNIIAFGKAITSGNGPLAITIAESKYGDLKYGTSEKTNGANVRSLVAADVVLDRLLSVPDEHIPEFVTGNLRRELSQGLLSTVAIKSHILENIYWT